MNSISRGLAAVIALGLPFASPVAAQPSVIERVVYADLDLRSDAGAAELVRRIRKAAVSVCDRDGANRGPSLEAQDRFAACRATAIEGALARLDAGKVLIARR